MEILNRTAQITCVELQSRTEFVLDNHERAAL